MNQKFKSVLSKNPGLGFLRNIAKVFEDTKVDLPEEVTANDSACLKYAPIVSVDVERSFSIYKSILTDRRRQLTPSNIRKIIVTNCFYNNNSNSDV